MADGAPESSNVGQRMLTSPRRPLSRSPTRVGIAASAAGAAFGPRGSVVQMHERGRALARPVVVAAVVGVLFALCFAGALHSPTPHGMDVAVVAPPPVTRQLQGLLEERAPGAFHVEPVPSARAAEDAVLRREAAGAFIAD